MLYKYRHLNDRSLRMVECPELYFALPSSLNDPLELEALVTFQGTYLDVASHFQEYLHVLEAKYNNELADLKRKYPRYIDGDLSIWANYHRRFSRVQEFESRINFAKSLVDEA